MPTIRELFTFPVSREDVEWQRVIEVQMCPLAQKRCFKVRKSQPQQSIGTCTVGVGKDCKDVIICPNRMLERKQIFADCLHLLTLHQPGNELHIVPEVTIPGGNVDYFLVSTDSQRMVKDFVGIEVQTMDTTGSIWAERAQLLARWGIAASEPANGQPFGINWKMTAKTILLQLHHKIQTFESLHKSLVLVVQDQLLDYIIKNFHFEAFHCPPQSGDSMHIHSYQLLHEPNNYKIALHRRYSSNGEGIAQLLGLHAEANLGMDTMCRALEAKLSDKTVFSIA